MTSCPVTSCCLLCVQPDEEESRYEQEGDEGAVGFIAHVPVPSQKEVRTFLFPVHVKTVSCGKR